MNSTQLEFVADNAGSGQNAKILDYPDIVLHRSGRVYSLKLARFLADGREGLKKGHYLRVTINRNKVRLHVLMARAFIGPRPSPKHLCLHRDDDKGNNIPENLYWGTKKDNTEDARRNGKLCVGSEVYCAKLSESAVRKIRRLRLRGEKQPALAAKFGVCQSVISEIVNHKIWRHVA